ncbi:MAG TPA: hypothetical protein PLW09_06630 [Candidatus Kapabacteria bacterium]|jgi:hypothetical protein|nr:hypothetical protein [Candidatus Kapabacteria bacterium]
MNIQAVKAYSQASGSRPSLPVRRRERITDSFDTAVSEPSRAKVSEAAGQSGSGQGIAARHYVMRAYGQESVQKESYTVFTKNGSLQEEQATKGTLFDGRA